MFERSYQTVRKTLSDWRSILRGEAISSRLFIAMSTFAAVMWVQKDAMAVAPVEVGHVAHIDKASTEYEIRRDRERAQVVLPVYIPAPVYSGDRIVVKSNDAHILINWNKWVKRPDGEKSTLLNRERTHGDRGYLVSDPVRPSMQSQLFTKISQPTKDIGKSLNKLRDKLIRSSQTSEQVDAISRSNGDPLSVGILQRPKVVVIEGTREFTLSWIGGKAPFKVFLLKIGVSEPVIEMTVDKRQLPPQPRPLKPGNYRVEVYDDKKSKPIVKEFEVIRQSTLPHLSDTFDIVGSPEIEKVFRLAWLARQDSGQWAFEVYLQLEEYLQDNNFTDSHSIAHALRHELATGGVP